MRSLARQFTLLLLAWTVSPLLAQQPEKPATRAGEEVEGKKRKPNRLIDEKSPYLLQHAHNPVNWYPWGEAAFRAARESDRPIFLSIGYSTCHWCHVMERESFEDEEIAAALNRDYIAIKVDREERPDVDEVYMAAVIAVRQQGGWPLSAFLTPEGKPFFLGTYFPPRDHPQRGPGFLSLLGRVSEAWRDRRAEILKSADSIASHLQRDVGPSPAAEPWSRTLLDAGFEEISDTYDNVYAGFGYAPRYAPKFPRTSKVRFLLGYHYLTGETGALEMATSTLERMAAGGIYDHLGRGFHRYSVDREWRVPHFEKMLYDNALISGTYLDAYRWTGNRDFLEVAEESLGYLLTRMQDPGGGFHSAEDADSEGEEGKYYVFTRREVLGILGAKEGALFAERHGITEKGNFEHGASVLHRAATIEELSESTKRSASDIRASLERSRLRLLEVRAKRIPPLKDDKVLTDWNGLAISAMSLAYQATGRARYLEAARKAARFIRSRLTRDGKLLHRYRDGEARYLAYFEDHAFLATGLLDLYESSLDITHLEEARRLALEMVRQFWDDAKGGFFHTGSGHEKLIVRTKEYYDGAIPSGNSVAAGVLHRIVAYTGDADLAARAATMARLAVSLSKISPERYPQMLTAAARALAPRIDIVVVASPGDAAGQALVREVHGRYLPGGTLVRADRAGIGQAAALIPWLKEIDLAGEGGKAHARVRRSGGNFERVASPAELGALLEKRR